METEVVGKKSDLPQVSDIPYHIKYTLSRAGIDLTAIPVLDLRQVVLLNDLYLFITLHPVYIVF